MDCTSEAAKPVCEKYGVSGYPTLKVFSKDSPAMGEEYEGGRSYPELFSFVEKRSKPPCEVKTKWNCNKMEKDFIEETKDWDEAKMKAEKENYAKVIEDSKVKHKDLSALFEKQKEEALATMKSQEDAKKEMEKVTKEIKFKISLLVQKAQMDGEAKEEAVPAAARAEAERLAAAEAAEKKEEL